MREIGFDPLILATIVAVGIGLLIGTERERSKHAGLDIDIAGVRTFTLAALLGVFASALAHPAALVVFGVAVAAITLAGYFKNDSTDLGITTEIALLCTFALGALSVRHPAYSAGAAVVITLLLASRPWLHDAVKNRLTDRELHDGLVLLAAALIVLPLLPNRTVDPWEVINPRGLWLIVVLVLSLNAAAYIALRIFGPRRGLMVAGVLGGFVSSTSTHAAMAQRATAQPSLCTSTAAAANLSSVATSVLLLIVVGAVQPQLARELFIPFATSAIICGLYGLFLLFRREQHEGADLELGRPLSIRAALTFGALVGAVILGSTLLQRTLGAGGAVVGIAFAGLADAHSAAISAAVLRRSDVLSSFNAQLAILTGFTANALVKVIVSMTTGPRGFWLHIAGNIVLSVAATWTVWSLLR